uniref:Uncharacterized protein n=1 Tax=Anguilla anguilla TaxID=7936 RepID=A0A0E9W364_ANGAN
MYQKYAYVPVCIPYAGDFSRDVLRGWMVQVKLNGSLPASSSSSSPSRSDTTSPSRTFCRRTPS